MLTALAKHGGELETVTSIHFARRLTDSVHALPGMSLQLKCKGDLWIDDHHSAEDCALALGAGECDCYTLVITYLHPLTCFYCLQLSSKLWENDEASSDTVPAMRH